MNRKIENNTEKIISTDLARIQPSYNRFLRGLIDTNHYYMFLFDKMQNCWSMMGLKIEENGINIAILRPRIDLK